MRIIMNNSKKAFGLLFAASILLATPVQATDFKYHRTVTLKVGQSIVLKGVRSHDCSDRAPSWDRIKRGLPRSKLGNFSNGGKGYTVSNSCGGRVAARGVKYTAKKSGKERLVIYDDSVRITVN